MQRSIDDGLTVVDLDTLTSTGLGNYNFTDRDPVNGPDLYRLKIVAPDSIVSYSNIVTINFPNAPTAVSNINVYPNPSNGMINLSMGPEPNF